MSGIINAQQSRSGIIGKIGIEVFTISINYPLESFQSGWSNQETTDFWMCRVDNLVFINAMLTYNTTGLSEGGTHHICTIKASSGLRPKTNQDMFGANGPGYQGETGFSTRIFANGQIICRHPHYQSGGDAAYYNNVNGVYELSH